MTQVASHFGSVVRLIDGLPVANISIKNQNVSPNCTLALASQLQVDAESIKFGKIILWLSAFLSDGHDAISRTSLRDQDKAAALTLYEALTKPFRYPFAGDTAQNHKKAMLAAERRSYMSLLDEVILREFPIFIPDPDEVAKITEELRKLMSDFEKFDLPSYIKSDFQESVELYILVAEKLPMVAHRLISEESGNFIKWLLSNLPDDARRTVAKTALAINVLVAAFVAPAEAADAASSYYRYFNDTFASQPAIEASVAPKALPSPTKLPVDAPKEAD